MNVSWDTLWFNESKSNQLVEEKFIISSTVMEAPPSEQVPNYSLPHQRVRVLRVAASSSRCIWRCCSLWPERRCHSDGRFDASSRMRHQQAVMRSSYAPFISPFPTAREQKRKDQIKGKQQYTKYYSILYPE